MSISVASFIEKAGRTIPRFTVASRRIANPDMSLNDLRAEIWRRRTEFWLRKAVELPKTAEAAKVEWAGVKQALASPGEITYKQVAKASVWGIQIFGAFCIGEVIGRANLVGYPVGDYPGAVKYAKHPAAALSAAENAHH